MTELDAAREKPTEDLSRDFRADSGCVPFLSRAGSALLERGDEEARVFVDGIFVRWLARFGPKAAPAVDALRYYVRRTGQLGSEELVETCRTLAAIEPAPEAAVPELRSLVRNEYQIPNLRGDLPGAQKVRAAAKEALKSVEGDR
ncbi:MAG: hypothetical protein AAF517_28250 [Planctomycetota bacterium]